MAAATPPSTMHASTPSSSSAASASSASCSAIAALPCVFVVALGRTGSTHLLRLLNAIPGYRLSGETDNAWIYLGWWNAAQRQQQPQEAVTRRLATATAADAMLRGGNANGFVEERTLCALRELVLLLHNPLPRARVFGFKEIYTPFVRDPSATAEVLTHGVGFLRRLFPRARFVFHTRQNLTHAADSDFWRHGWPNGLRPEHGERLRRISAAAQLYNSYATAHPEHAMATTLEGLTDKSGSGGGEVEALFRFLGEPLTPKLRKLARSHLPLKDWVEERRTRGLVTVRAANGSVLGVERKRTRKSGGGGGAGQKKPHRRKGGGGG